MACLPMRTWRASLPACRPPCDAREDSTYDERVAWDPRRHSNRRKAEQPVRITTAATSRDADISARQRRYVLSMGFRTLCFVAAVVVGAGWLRWVLIVAALALPYVAVVMANAVNSKDDAFELRAQPPTTRELPPAGPNPWREDAERRGEA